jgi:hypothetical protein
MTDSETPTQATKPVDKAGRMAKHELALAAVDTARKSLLDVREAAVAAEIAHAEALAEAERLYGEAYAEDIMAAVQTAKVAEKRHAHQCEEHRARIHKRRLEREKRGDALPAPHLIKVFTVDGATHEVVSAHELLVGSTGIASGKPAHGSRFKAGCGLSVDAPHDELDHERFDQTAAPSCAKCGAAIAMMGTGEIADERGEYLSSKEQLAHVRGVYRRRNQESSGRPLRPSGENQ